MVRLVPKGTPFPAYGFTCLADPLTRLSGVRFYQVQKSASGYVGSLWVNAALGGKTMQGWLAAVSTDASIFLSGAKVPAIKKWGIAIHVAMLARSSWKTCFARWGVVRVLEKNKGV